MNLKSLALLGVLLATTSCVDLDGSMRVTEGFDIKIKSGFLKLSKKEINLSPGSYSAELKLKSEKNASIKLSGAGIGNITIPIKSDSRLNMTSNGRFRIEGSEIDQPFNIDGNIITNITRYGHSSEYQSCMKYSTRTVCEKGCYTVPGRHGNGDGRRHHRDEMRCETICREMSVTETGSKFVNFHYKKTDRQVTLDIMRDNSTFIAATLSASGTEEDKIIDNESNCR